MLTSVPSALVIKLIGVKSKANLCEADRIAGPGKTKCLAV